jgi:hypothetical protein
MALNYSTLLKSIKKRRKKMHTKRAIFIVVIVFGLMLTIPLAQAGEYDMTQCSSGTSSLLFSSENLTIYTFENKGITRSNTSDKDFDNATYHCVGIGRVVGKDVFIIGNCKFQAPDGSIHVGEFDGKNREGTWKYLYGTGRFEGIQGGGPWKAITGGKPITPGTFQGCERSTGTFSLKK